MALTDKLTAIADAIRAKTGKTDTMTLEQMPAEISDISSGGSVALTPACQVRITGVEIKDPLYFNHEPFQPIPAEAAEYPYALILRNLSGEQRLWVCKTRPFCTTDSDGQLILKLPAYRMYFKASACWCPMSASPTEGEYALDGAGQWVIWWSGFDIPYESADGTEIYRCGSEALTEQPAEATHFYFNNVILPKIPADVLAAYPYVWIRKNTTSGYYDLFFNTAACYVISDTQASGSGDTKPWYQVEIATAESAAEWTYYKDTTSSLALDSDRTVLWSNHNMPKGNANATTIYLYGTQAVPASC